MAIKLSDARIASIFLVSVCILAFEIEIMRCFSVASWSNFGSMVISIALLGFGLAGTLLTFMGKSIRRSPDRWLVGASFAFAPSMAVSHVIAQRIPFNPVLIASDPSQLWWIGAYYIVYSVPFFIAGIFIGTGFNVLSSRTHQLYFWNMLGSGLGGLLILGLMYLFPPDSLLYPLVGLAIMPAMLCSLRWSSVESRFTLRGGEIALCAALAVFCFTLLVYFGKLSVSDFKPISYARKFPDSSEVYTSFSPRGQMHVYSSSYFHFAPGLSDKASVSIAKMPKDAFLGMYIDGDGPVGIMRKLQPDEENYIDFLPMSAPYLVLQKPRVLLLRLGGGAGVQIALHHHSTSVRVVESNPDLIHMMVDVPYFRDFTGGVLQDPRVTIMNAEVRSFAGSTREKFDLVEIGLIDSIGLSQAGGYSIEENYTYTTEAIRGYLKCISPGGILSITVWDRLSPPRNVPKLLSTIVEALRLDRVQQPEKNIFAFNLLLSTATVLVKNSAFTDDETEVLSRYCRRMAFEVDFAPGQSVRKKDFGGILDGYTAIYAAPPGDEIPQKEKEIDLIPSDLYHFSLNWLLCGKSEELFSRYVFDIKPATDDKPYFSGYIKPGMIPDLIPHLREISEEWGYLLLLATFLQSLLFGFFIFLLPLSLRRKELFAGKYGTPGVILYFACLGLGYMMGEIFLIQRFVYFLADPIYANSIVITILLVSSGIGSLVSGRSRVERTMLVRLAACGISISAVFFLFGLPALLDRFLGAPLAVKVLLAAAFIAPAGVCMGIPFPAGLSALSESRKGILSWAWGMNGALSVAGSVFTRIVSTQAGFSMVLAVMAGLYVAAGLLFHANEMEARRKS